MKQKCVIDIRGEREGKYKEEKNTRGSDLIDHSCNFSSFVMQSLAVLFM
jgi:hypothetical protein